MVAKKRDTRFPIKLPPWHEKRLIYWAGCKGTTKTQLAQNTLQARIEANADQIEEMIQELAGDQGMTVRELKSLLLAKGRYTESSIEDEEEGSE